MKPLRINALTIGLLAGIACTGSLAGNEDTEASFLEVFTSERLRLEFADVDASGTGSSELLSLRSRPGIRSREFAGFTFLLEGEHNWILTDTEQYRSFPNGKPENRTLIADPDNFQLNRLQVAGRSPDGAVEGVVGRQALSLWDERFLGTVGWRQNDQTYDAAQVTGQPHERIRLSYFYIDRVLRAFGSDAISENLRRWDSDSHVGVMEFDLVPGIRLSGFAFLLDFEQSEENSSDTYGLEFVGSPEAMPGAIRVRGTAAMQRDAAPDERSEHSFFRLRLERGRETLTLGLGGEAISSRSGCSFRFPLGTNHKFNGYADAFLTPPDDGLYDVHAWIGMKALAWKHRLILHHFSTEEDHRDLGVEYDYVISRPISEEATVICKLAHLEGESEQVDITRVSLELNYIF